MNKKLKTILIILIVILLSIISFFGIYQKENYKYSNKIPEYKYTKSLSKTVVANLKIDETTNTVKYDENGNVVTDTEESTEENTNYTTKEEPVNAEEVKTVENYKLCKQIIEKRLKDIGLPEYMVRIDEKTGNVQIEFEEDSNVEAGMYYASYVGKAEFLNDNKEVQLDNSDIQKAEVGYNQNKTGAYQVYLNVTLNKQGQEKIKKLKDENINNENSSEVTDENETEKNDNTIKTTEKTDTTLSFKFEDEEIGTVSLSDITNDKNIRINIESASSNTTTINNYLNQGAVMSILINSGKMPIKYEIENSQEFISTITNTQENIIIGILIGILAVASIYVIIRYKKDGLAIAVSNIASAAILLLLLRYTNVLIGYEAFFAIFILEISMIYCNKIILNKLKNITEKEEVKKELGKSYKKIMDIIFILILVAITFTFIKWTEISTIGMVIFWGIISIIITHFIFTRTLLLNNRK